MYHILYWQHHEKLMSDLGRIHTKLYVLKSNIILIYRASQKALSDISQVLR